MLRFAIAQANARRQSIGARIAARLDCVNNEISLAESARLMRVRHRPVLARAHKTGHISCNPVAARPGDIVKVTVDRMLFTCGESLKRSARTVPSASRHVVSVSLKRHPVKQLRMTVVMACIGCSVPAVVIVSPSARALWANTPRHYPGDNR
jgi:hypothetical protein